MEIDLIKEATQYNHKTPISDLIVDRIFIAGAKSKYVKCKIIQAKLDLLKELDDRLESKKRLINDLISESPGLVKNSRLFSKKSGIRLCQEEIRTLVLDLKTELNEIK